MKRWRVTLAVLVAIASVLSAAAAQAAYSSTPRSGTWVPNGRVNAIAVAGDRVYIGGNFTSVRNPATGVSVPRGRLAAFDAATGELVASFAPSADSIVNALAVSADGATVYAGGNFLNVNGTPQSRMAALDADGRLVPGWTSPALGSVRDVVVHGAAVYAAGKFPTSTGGGRFGAVRLDAASGSVDTSWRAWVGEGRPYSLAVSPDGSKLVVGGSFKVVDGVRHSYLAAVTVAGGDLTSWRPPALCDDCYVLDVVTNANDVYAALGGPGGRVGAWDADLDVLNWQRRADGDVQAVAYHEGVVYVGGHFETNFANAPRNQLAAATADDGTLLDFVPSFTGLSSPGIWALAAGPDYLRAGGGFQGVVGGTQKRYAEFPYF